MISGAGGISGSFIYGVQCVLMLFRELSESSPTLPEPVGPHILTLSRSLGVYGPGSSSYTPNVATE
jgi:hypothetical protein